MSAPLADVTQTQTRLPPGQLARASEMPPPPPPEAIIESRLAAAAKMRRPTAAPVDDGFGSRFAPWAAQGRPSSAGNAAPALGRPAAPQTTGSGPRAEPPVFVVPVEEAKLENLRSALAALTGRTKTPGRDTCDLAVLLGALDENDPLFGSARLRRTASSALTFGQRATRTVRKSHEAAAYVLRLPAADGSRDLELRISLKHLPAQNGKTSSFLEIAGTTPLSSGGDVQRVDELRKRLTQVWGR